VRHVYYCPLRWADMDSLGHVNNVTYVDYLQEARVDMLAVHAPETGGEALAEGVVVVRHEVEFVAPLVFRPDPVRIETWVSRIRAASFTMRYEILDELPDGERRVYTRASTVLTPFVFATERPRRISEAENDVLQGFYEADEGARV
jgi:acyl-CoA thioester hydrolase